MKKIAGTKNYKLNKEASPAASAAAGAAAAASGPYLQLEPYTGQDAESEIAHFYKKFVNVTTDQIRPLHARIKAIEERIKALEDKG